MIVVEGPAGNGMGGKIAGRLGCELIESLRNTFADGESEVGVRKAVGGEDVVLVQTTYPDPNKRLIELMLLAKDSVDLGARKVSAVVPYLAYGKQDKRFEGKGNAVSIKSVLELLGASGISTLITVAPHKTSSLSYFPGRVLVADAVAPLAEAVRDKVTDPIIMAPDKGALDIVKQAAQIIGCSYTYIEKQRDVLSGTVSVKGVGEGDLRGKEVVILDDMINKGSTIVMAAGLARERGAKTIMVAAAHLLMVGDAYQKIKEAGVDELCGTNTVSFDKAHMVDISGQLAKLCRNLS